MLRGVGRGANAVPYPGGPWSGEGKRRGRQAVGAPEADIRGTYGDLREKTHSSFFFFLFL